MNASASAHVPTGAVDEACIPPTRNEPPAIWTSAWPPRGEGADGPPIEAVALPHFVVKSSKTQSCRSVASAPAVAARAARAERGYYVFPVAVVDRMLRDNGLPGPGEMHQVPLARLGEVAPTP